MARKMKDSGIEWIGEIPEDWKIGKLKNICDISGRIGFRGYTQEDLVAEGEGAITLSPSNFSNMKMNYKKCSYITWEKYYESPEIQIKNGDILFVKTGSTYGKSCLVSDLPMEATINPQMILIKNIKISNKYLAYFLQCKVVDNQIETAVVGGTIPTIAQEKIKNFVILFPNADMQQKIVDFLDEKVGEIDTIIARTKETIEEYKKYRKAVVIKAVTKGLHSGVAMKKTDSDWIGEIPVHWDYVRIQRLFETVDERNENPEATLLSLYTAIGVKPRNELEEKGNKAITVMNYKKVQKNDIIVNKLLAWMGAIGYSDYEGVTSPDYDVYRAKKDANVVRSYYNEYFRNTCFNGDCYKYGHGIMLMRWRTYPEEFLRIKVPNPPLEEQQEIAKYLDEKCGEIDDLIVKKEAFIEEMETYKKSLIYEYVTGKKEVV